MRDATTVTITGLVPASDLSDTALAERVRALYPHLDRGSAYGRYVQALNLCPRLDAKDWLPLWDVAAPNAHLRQTDVPFVATHRDTLNDALVMVTPILDGETVLRHQLVWEYGSVGSDPGPLSARYVPLPPLPTSQETHADIIRFALRHGYDPASGGPHLLVGIWNLDAFEPAYVLACLRRLAADDRYTDLTRRQANAAIAALETGPCP